MGGEMSMFLDYPNKMKEKDVLKKTKSIRLLQINQDYQGDNKLILGDNFDALKCLLYDFELGGKVDLIYIDPPFSTNTIFRISETRANTISSSLSDSVAYNDLISGSDFIEFLRCELILLRELMSERASIYLHIDYKIGHYVKIIMDEIFGVRNFRNDITRIKCNPKNFKRRAYGNIKDLILFYTKSDKYTWNEPRVELTDDDVKKLFRKVDEKGRLYTTIPLHAPGETKNGPTGQPWRDIPPPTGRHWRSSPDVLEQLDKDGLIEWSSKGVPRKINYAHDALNKGKKLQDIWEFKDPQYPNYPTEKNIELLKLIISSSSNPGDMVLDCFAGSGTTLLASHELERKWIGIDQSEQAISIIKKRLSKIKRTLFISEPKFEEFEIYKE